MSNLHRPILYYPAYVRMRCPETRISPSHQPKVKYYPERSQENYCSTECCCRTCCSICSSNVSQEMPFPHKNGYAAYNYQRVEAISQCGPSCTCQKVPNYDRSESFPGRSTIIRSRRDQLEAMMDEMSDYHSLRHRYLHATPHQDEYHTRRSSKYYQLYKSAFTAQIHGSRETKAKRFPCMYCDKSFGKSSHLRDHVRTHTGERPYRCSWCNKAFTQYSNLRTHMRIHTGEKPYSCKYCLKSFTQAVTLRSHLRTHSEEEEKAETF